jgi:hypothetical protein
MASNLEALRGAALLLKFFLPLGQGESQQQMEQEAYKGPMSLLEPPPVKSHKSQVMAFTIGALVVALALVLYFTYRYYPEKKAAAHFFDALVVGDTEKAYQLLKPTES